ncbi:hypothetical protein DQ04_08751010 [Trypanosoma grayi]|uniref:hypothetical protein n=1 Tax=Trypanosoma grayi TaxID=71804 RepID=UPI0004F41DAB|nr:hypothetical protein DQ04_08751010 [Trypanosoma grayi]KEG07815.1 hypothetical protein DQ04_08751010 [Trypanosoma grayi]
MKPFKKLFCERFSFTICATRYGRSGDSPLYQKTASSMTARLLPLVRYLSSFAYEKLDTISTAVFCCPRVPFPRKGRCHYCSLRKNCGGTSYAWHIFVEAVTSGDYINAALRKWQCAVYICILESVASWYYLLVCR